MIAACGDVAPRTTTHESIYETMWGKRRKPTSTKTARSHVTGNAFIILKYYYCNIHRYLRGYITDTFICISVNGDSSITQAPKSPEGRVRRACPAAVFHIPRCCSMAAADVRAKRALRQRILSCRALTLYPYPTRQIP